MGPSLNSDGTGVRFVDPEDAPEELQWGRPALNSDGSADELAMQELELNALQWGRH